MKQFLGIDVSKNTLDVHLLDHDAQQVSIKDAFPNTKVGIEALVRQLPQPDNTIVVFESTGVYGKRLTALLPSCVELACEVNPRVIRNLKLSMTSTKTDATDARAIAMAARTLHLTNPQILQRYAVQTVRDDDLAVLLGESDRLHKAIARLRQQIDNISCRPGPAARLVETRMRAELRWLLTSHKEVKSLIENRASGQEVDLVESICGIGTLTAAALVNRIVNIDRFKEADHLKSYLGIYPSIRQSGKHKGRGHMAKHGDALIRHRLFNCAKVAARFNPVCKPLYDRLRNKGHNGVYAYCAVMRKLVQLVYGVLKTKRPFDPNWTLTCNG